MKKRYFWPLVLGGLVSCGAAMAATGPTPGVETQTQYLSGHGSDDAVLWDFYVTDGRKANAWAKIPVPSCWEQEGFGTYIYGLNFRPTAGQPAPEVPHEQGFYRYDFAVPAGWKDQTVRIVFAGVMADADVKINGQSAGPAHQGSFYEFKYDISKLLKFGETNRLEVWVSKESANASVNRAERRGDYWNFGGIYRPVHLEAMPKEFIDWTAIDAKADGSFFGQIHFGAPTSGSATVAAQILDAQGQAVGAPVSAKVEAGQEVVALRTQLTGAKLWTAETPNLYRVRFTFALAGAAEHVVTERFGFRTIEIRDGDGFYLNGQRVILKGVNRHSFWPETGRTLNKQMCYDDAKLIKEANMNAVRMSHYPPDRDFLEACDELGIYVLDELGGWQGAYDEPTGKPLIGEMVRRDVNHPSILFWDNGNEGGWTTANDGEFAKWDPQQRHVFHPRSTDHGVNDPHYPTYAQVAAQVDGPQVYFPTEFLHGLYDGGAGTGLHDFWAAMSKGKAIGGGMIWAFADEAVARTDEDGKLDARGNLAPDGIVGPHHEKEGSFYTIKEIWSPVQIPTLVPQNDMAFLPVVENDYDFTNLKECTFAWELAAFPAPGDGSAGHKVLASGEIHGPDVAPHAQGSLALPVGIGPTVNKADALYVSAKNPQGRVVWTWAWPLVKAANSQASANNGGGKVQTSDAGGQIAVTAGSLELRYSKTTGSLDAVTVGGKAVSLGNGPRFVAYQHQRGTGAGVGGGSAANVYQDKAEPTTLASLAARADGNDVVVEAKYNGPLAAATWRVSPGGAVRLDYTYNFEGLVDLIGVNFDYPETQVKGITWLGMGPYRVWQNRMDGTTLDVWKNTYNDAVPGESWQYPEFKGYFRGWRWAVLETGEGRLTVRNASAQDSFLGVFTPRDANVGPLQEFPKTGLAFLDVIPSMRDKGKQQEQLGPQGQTQTVSGAHSGAVVFEFGGK